jgi:23S rRNA (adenine2503-C2)-methyltransferase
VKQALELPGLDQAELIDFVESLGEPSYRGRQLFAAVQKRRLRTFDEITDLPKEFRARLQEIAAASTLTIESRYISQTAQGVATMKTHDGRPVETVFIPEERRDTICFSSQSGCPLQYVLFDCATPDYCVHLLQARLLNK